MIAFEIALNGEKAATVGLDGGVFSVMVSIVDDGSKAVQLNASGTSELPSRDGYLHWPLPEVGVGDEIMIRIVETEHVDLGVPIEA